jgi:cell wall-associated NlpC family hydrolase
MSDSELPTTDPQQVPIRPPVAPQATKETNPVRSRSTTSLLAHRRSVLRLTAVALAGAGCLATVAAPAAAKPAAKRVAASQAAQAYNEANLRMAATAIEQQAVAIGAMPRIKYPNKPAKGLLAGVAALTRAARKADPSGAITDTRAVMGPVPQAVLAATKHAKHHHVAATHTLQPFQHGIADAGASGTGLNAKHDGSRPALLQQADGVFVQPHLQPLSHPTVGEEAIRTALGQLGKPYVWAAAGPSSFDCSGLTQWAYAHAGVPLAHYTGDQWNEGKLVPHRDLLPGDLVLFGSTIDHVGIYLGAGWMINAPYTGQYVDVMPVFSGVNGVVRP